MHRYVCVLACIGLVGCASDDGDVVRDPIELEALISFVSDPAQPEHKGYSAFDGNVHDYRVVAHVLSVSDAPTATNPDPVLASSLVWSVEEAWLKQEPYTASNAALLVSTKKPGRTTIKVSGKRMSGALVHSAATLEISQASSDEWTTGAERYRVGVPNDARGSRSTDAAADMSACDLPGTTFDKLAQTSACANCHDNASGITAAPTPEQVAGYSDDDLIQIFTTGWKPPEYVFKSNILKYVPKPECVYQAFHTWDIDDASQKGLVWKMRSLMPMVPDSDM